MKLVVLVIVILLVHFNFVICDFVAGDNINLWWTVKLNLYSFSFGLLFIIMSQKIEGKLEKYFNFTRYVGIGLVGADVIDRCFFSITWFTWTDLVLVSVVLLIAYRKHLCSKGSNKYPNIG